MTRTGLTWPNVFVFGLIALAIVAALARCQPHTMPPEPPFVIIGDAQALLDAGPDASPCARACSTFARLECREAMGNCVGVCERTRAYGLMTDLTVGCLSAAKDRDAVHVCGAFCP